MLAETINVIKYRGKYRIITPVVKHRGGQLPWKDTPRISAVVG